MHVIKRLTPGTLAENLTVKRKYKTNQEGVSQEMVVCDTW